MAKSGADGLKRFGKETMPVLYSFVRFPLQILHCRDCLNPHCMDLGFIRCFLAQVRKVQQVEPDLRDGAAMQATEGCWLAEPEDLGPDDGLP